MKQFTFGYIDHDKAVHEKHLGFSLANLEGEFDVLSAPSSAKFPAANYNDIVSLAKTPYIILSHQDVSFMSDLLEKLQLTISMIPNFGALGLIGAPGYHWSSSIQIFDVETVDSCFIVTRTDNPIKFDDVNFGEFHLYVEDYCAQLKVNLGKSISTILTDGMMHHSATLSVRGSCWGNYGLFKEKFNNKWPGIRTT